MGQLAAGCLHHRLLDRRLLDVCTRELLTFSMLVALGGADPQVKAHVAANLNVGKRRPTCYITLPSGASKGSVSPWRRKSHRSESA